MDADDLQDLFSAFGPVRARRMFGGSGLYADGLMFALESDGVIYLKADAALAAALEARGSSPFTYEARKPGSADGGETVVRVMKSYWRLPEDALDDGEDLADLSRRALNAARRAAPKPAARGRARRSARNED